MLRESEAYGPSSFQSTLSMRRATTRRVCRLLHGWKISIHALHEESDWQMTNATTYSHISIHALHEESDSSSIRKEK